MFERYYLIYQIKTFFIDSNEIKIFLPRIKKKDYDAAKADILWIVPSITLNFLSVN